LQAACCLLAREGLLLRRCDLLILRDLAWCWRDVDAASTLSERVECAYAGGGGRGFLRGDA
jgi:hypothetical protein